MLSAQGGRFREIIAFHCQQAVEKYLKALLVRRQVEFPKTHDIAKLLVLTPFGVEVRYPSEAPEVLQGGETEAIGIARRVRNAVMISLQPYLDGG